MKAYAYEVGSALKLNRNYGKVFFSTGVAADAVAAFNKLNEKMLSGVTKCQLSEKLISYDKKAFSTAQVKDLTSISFTLYNNADPTKQARFYFPGIEPIKIATGPNAGKRDDEAMAAVIKEVANEFIAKGICLEDGTLLDTYLTPGLPKYNLDVTTQDTLDIRRTA